MSRHQPMETARQRCWQKIEELWEQNKDLDSEEVERLVDAEVAADRAERRAKRQQEREAGDR